MQSKIILNNQEYQYIINRKKIKNIYFRVKEDLIIHVNVNHLVSQKQIEKMLVQNSDAIINMYNNVYNKLNEGIKYLGDELTLIKEDTKPYIRGSSIYARSELDAKNYIYSLAKEVFITRLNAITPLFDDLPNFEFRVRKMKSKWGVCNKGSMSITLNTELITKDISLIDYVIIHELCHFKYMNHSKEYWNYLKQFYPYYKEARKELKY